MHSNYEEELQRTDILETHRPLTLIQSLLSAYWFAAILSVILTWISDLAHHLSRHGKTLETSKASCYCRDEQSATNKAPCHLVPLLVTAHRHRISKRTDCYDHYRQNSYESNHAGSSASCSSASTSHSSCCSGIQTNEAQDCLTTTTFQHSSGHLRVKRYNYPTGMRNMGSSSNNNSSSSNSRNRSSSSGSSSRNITNNSPGVTSIGSSSSSSNSNVSGSHISSIITTSNMRNMNNRSGRNSNEVMERNSIGRHKKSVSSEPHAPNAPSSPPLNIHASRTDSQQTEKSTDKQRSISTLSPKYNRNCRRNGEVLSSCQKLTEVFLRQCLVPKSKFWHFYFLGICTIGMLYDGRPLLQLQMQISKNSVFPTLEGFDTEARRFKTSDSSTSFHPFTSTPPSLAMILFTLHLTRRLLEQLFVVVSTRSSQMHLCAYLLGLSFYIAAPFSLVASCNDRPDGTPRGLLFHSKKAIGVTAVFLIANMLQFACHKQLASLRSLGGSSTISVIPKSTERRISLATLSAEGLDSEQERLRVSALPCYSVPQGRLFQHVSCPHYAMEVVIYLCLFVIKSLDELPLTRNHLPDKNMLLCTVFVVLTMVSNGLRTHWWYLQTFASLYPKQRKAIFPFVL